MTRAIKGVLTILTSLALGALLVAGALVAKAQAQSRYDTDQQWIRGTLRAERKARREREEARQEERERERREERAKEWARERQAELNRERWQRTHDRYYGYRSDEHPSTRVYGMVMRSRTFVERDATSNVACYPQIQGFSVEYQTTASAQADAERDWANRARFQYGERYMDLRNAELKELQCTIASVKQSVSGRIAQGIKEAVGGDEVGNTFRCVIRAAPCQAPTEVDPATKGDRR